MLRWLLSSILVTVVAAFLRVAFYFVDETQGLVRRQQKTVEEEMATVQAAREHLAQSDDSGATGSSHATDEYATRGRPERSLQNRRRRITGVDGGTARLRGVGGQVVCRFW